MLPNLFSYGALTAYCCCYKETTLVFCSGKVTVYYPHSILSPNLGLPRFRYSTLAAKMSSLQQSLITRLKGRPSQSHWTLLPCSWNWWCSPGGLLSGNPGCHGNLPQCFIVLQLHVRVFQCWFFRYPETMSRVIKITMSSGKALVWQ